MEGRWLGLGVVAALVLGVGIGCGLGGGASAPEEQARNDVPAGDSGIEANIQRAVAYLEDVHGASQNTGLLYEAPDGTRTVDGVSWRLNQVYWTQTDNFLAALALRPHNPNLSESIGIYLDCNHQVWGPVRFQAKRDRSPERHDDSRRREGCQNHHRGD